jgi:hypothetical protein
MSSLTQRDVIGGVLIVDKAVGLDDGLQALWYSRG